MDIDTIFNKCREVSKQDLKIMNKNYDLEKIPKHIHCKEWSCQKTKNERFIHIYPTIFELRYPYQYKYKFTIPFHYTNLPDILYKNFQCLNFHIKNVEHIEIYKNGSIIESIDKSMFNYIWSTYYKKTANTFLPSIYLSQMPYDNTSNIEILISSNVKIPQFHLVFEMYSFKRSPTFFAFFFIESIINLLFRTEYTLHYSYDSIINLHSINTLLPPYIIIITKTFLIKTKETFDNTFNDIYLILNDVIKYKLQTTLFNNNIIVCNTEVYLRINNDDNIKILSTHKSGVKLFNDLEQIFLVNTVQITDTVMR